MQGQKLGEICGIWLTPEEVEADYLRVTDKDEAPIAGGDLYEGCVIRMKGACVVFEAFFLDPKANRWFMVQL